MEDGVILSPQYEKLTFGELAEAAAKLTPPKDIALKPASRVHAGRQVAEAQGHTVEGRRQLRLRHRRATTRTCCTQRWRSRPVLGGSVKTFDGEKALAMPGVTAVVPTSSGVAVVADSWWRAARRAMRVKIEWDAGPNAALNDAKISQTLRKGAAGAGRVMRNDGDVAAAIKGAAKVVRADYELPLLAHATMEPQNCTADVRADGVRRLRADAGPAAGPNGCRARPRASTASW